MIAQPSLRVLEGLERFGVPASEPVEHADEQREVPQADHGACQDVWLGVLHDPDDVTDRLGVVADAGDEREHEDRPRWPGDDVIAERPEAAEELSRRAASAVQNGELDSVVLLELERWCVHVGDSSRTDSTLETSATLRTRVNRAMWWNAHDSSGLRELP